MNTPELEEEKALLAETKQLVYGWAQLRAWGGWYGLCCSARRQIWVVPVQLNPTAGPSRCPAHGSRAPCLCPVLLVRAVLLGDGILHLMENVLGLQQRLDDCSLSLSWDYHCLWVSSFCSSQICFNSTCLRVLGCSDPSKHPIAPLWPPNSPSPHFSPL